MFTQSKEELEIKAAEQTKPQTAISRSFLASPAAQALTLLHFPGEKSADSSHIQVLFNSLEPL